MRPSHRFQTLAESPIRALAPLAEAARQRGLKVHHLNIGQPDTRTPGVMMQVLRETVPDVLGYGPAEGLPGFRRALLDYYRHYALPVEPQDLIVTTGGSEALLMAALGTCDPGDEVLVPEPFYANFAGFLHAAGARLVPVTCRAADGFHLPDDAVFEAAVTPRTRAVLYSSPGNPTGTVYDAAEVARLVAFAARHDLWVIADETYREFVYDGRAFASVLAEHAQWDRLVVADSISKRYSACGARVGSLVIKNRALYDAAMKYAQVRLCPPTLGQLVGSATVAHLHEYFEEVRAEYRARRDLCFERLSAMPGVRCRRPEGAFYMIAGLPVPDATAFARWLLTDFAHEGETVMYAPARGFYATPGLGADEVRLAYVLGRAELARALDLTERALATYPARTAAARE